MNTPKDPRAQRFLHRYGPWAVVTGASDGIGLELACELAARGASLLLVARRRGILEDLGHRLAAEHDINTRVLAADLSADTGIESVVEATTDLDVGLLVASAGFGTSGPFLDSNLANELDMLDVNCRAALALTHAFGRRFAARGRGGIVLMSSLLAFQGVPRAAHYAATKSFVQSLAEGLRAELAPHGVDVLASAPGPVQSGFASRADMRMSLALHPRQVSRATLDALGRRTTVRPGWLSKALEASLAPLPRSGRSKILAKVMEGMTRHQTEPDADVTQECSAERVRIH